MKCFSGNHGKDADREKVKEELADVFSFAFLLAKKYDFDVKEIILDKIKQNSEKYPIEKSKGRNTKYNKL
ncbi:MAG TPA: MazG-like family protein [Chitinophagaceae bacterium]|nr:MazG-like family protein [Chitinophagaceae bacterium]